MEKGAAVPPQRVDGGSLLTCKKEGWKCPVFWARKLIFHHQWSDEIQILTGDVWAFWGRLSPLGIEGFLFWTRVPGIPRAVCWSVVTGATNTNQTNSAWLCNPAQRGVKNSIESEKGKQPRTTRNRSHPFYLKQCHVINFYCFFFPKSDRFIERTPTFQPVSGGGTEHCSLVPLPMCWLPAVTADIAGLRTVCVTSVKPVQLVWTPYSVKTDNRRVGSQISPLV